MRDRTHYCPSSPRAEEAENIPNPLGWVAKGTLYPDSSWVVKSRTGKREGLDEQAEHTLICSPPDSLMLLLIWPIGNLMKE